MNWGTWFFLGLGVLCIVYGVLFKFWTLPLTYRARWYHTVRRNPDATHEMRYGIRTAFPVAAMCFALAAATVVVQTNALASLAIVIGGLGVAIVAPPLIPPRWIEPRWLREEEARETRGEPSTLPMPRQGRRIVVKPWQFWSTGLLLVAFLVVAVVFDLGAATVGVLVATGITSLATMWRWMKKSP